MAPESFRNVPDVFQAHTFDSASEEEESPAESRIEPTTIRGVSRLCYLPYLTIYSWVSIPIYSGRHHKTTYAGVLSHQIFDVMRHLHYAVRKQLQQRQQPTGTVLSEASSAPCLVPALRGRRPVPFGLFQANSKRRLFGTELRLQLGEDASDGFSGRVLGRGVAWGFASTCIISRC